MPPPPVAWTLPARASLERSPPSRLGQQSASPGQAEPAQPGPPSRRDGEQPAGMAEAAGTPCPHPTGTGVHLWDENPLPTGRTAALFRDSGPTAANQQPREQAEAHREAPASGRHQTAPRSRQGALQAESGRLAASPRGRDGAAAQPPREAPPQPSVGSLEDRPRREAEKARPELPACSGRGPGPGLEASPCLTLVETPGPRAGRRSHPGAPNHPVLPRKEAPPRSTHTALEKGP